MLSVACVQSVILTVIPLLAVQILAPASVTIPVLHPTTLTPTPTAHVCSVFLCKAISVLAELRQFDQADVSVDLLYCSFICVGTESLCTV